MTKARKLIKAGRKREAGAREPNGRLSRAVKREIQARSGTEIRRLCDAAVSGMRDPMWGTQLGRLLLAKKIEAHHFEAGRRWSTLVAAWRRYQVGPALDPKSGLAMLSEENRGRGYDGTNDEREIARIRQIDAELMDALGSLQAAGGEAAKVVRSCCETERSVVLARDLELLGKGLDALAEHWGLQ